MRTHSSAALPHPPKPPPLQHPTLHPHHPPPPPARAQAKLTQARQKAEAIANQEDVPMKSKMREIEKLYAQVRCISFRFFLLGGGGCECRP